MDGVTLRLDIHMMEQQMLSAIRQHLVTREADLTAAIRDACTAFDFETEIRAEVQRVLRETVRRQVSLGLARLDATAISTMLARTFEGLDRL